MQNKDIGYFAAAFCVFSAYVELYLGVYDIGRCYIWGDNRKNGGHYECGIGFRRGCSVFVYYNDWGHGAVGGADGDCTEVRTDCETDERNTAVYQFFVSANSGGASGERIYFYEFDC